MHSESSDIDHRHARDPKSGALLAGTMARRILVGLATAVSFVLGAGLARLLFHQPDGVSPSFTAAQTGASAPVPELQLVVIYLAQSSCPWCTNTDVKVAIRRSAERLRNLADSVGINIHLIGVAVERDVALGLQYLRDLGIFDEISAGGHWANSTALRYVWEQYQGDGAVPQLVVLARRFSTPQVTHSSLYWLDEEVVLLRKIGAFEIISWASNGMPMPQLPETIRREPGVLRDEGAT